MEPKKDVSTAILDQKKAPNKLLVIDILFRFKKPLMMKTPLFSYPKPRWVNWKFLKEMPYLLKEKRENKL